VRKKSDDGRVRDILSHFGKSVWIERLFVVTTLDDVAYTRSNRHDSAWQGGLTHPLPGGRRGCSMYLRLRHSLRAAQKIEVAAFVGLADVL
jgi:hypothetical protein